MNSPLRSIRQRSPNQRPRGQTIPADPPIVRPSAHPGLWAQTGSLPGSGSFLALCFSCVQPSFCERSSSGGAFFFNFFLSADFLPDIFFVLAGFFFLIFLGVIFAVYH